jgi:hypothetical protein
MKAEHLAEKARLIEYLRTCVRVDGGVPASRTRPDRAYVGLIARATGVPKSALSDREGRHREVLLRFVQKNGLRPYAGWNGGVFAFSDEVHARLVKWLHDRIAGGHGIPGRAGRPNFKAVAKLSGIDRSTLTMEGHRNRVAVEEAFEAAGAGPDRLRGPITIAEMLEALGG